jgi:hypothetical protein
MQVKLNKDIGDYEESVFIGMTLRQAVLGIIGVVIIAGSYFMMGYDADSMLASWAAIGLGLPCFLFAFARPNKMRLEKFLVIWVKSQLLAYRKRKYIAENKYYTACFVTEKEKRMKRRSRNNVVA